MARPLRLEFAGALYHVTARGDRRENIFEEDDDFQLMLARRSDKSQGDVIRRLEIMMSDGALLIRPTKVKKGTEGLFCVGDGEFSEIPIQSFAINPVIKRSETLKNKI